MNLKSQAIFAVLTIVLLSAPAMGVESQVAVDLSSVAPGDVIAVGSLVDGSCILTQTPAFLNPAGTFHAIWTTLDPATCEEIVAEVCVDAASCPALALDPDPASDNLMGAGIIDVLGPVVGVSSCPNQRTVASRHWTQGYGGSWDVLTDVRIAMEYAYGCSDGSADLVARDGKCLYASWNGWDTTSCYYQNPSVASGNVGSGTRGSFECYNSNFCRTNHYVHTLVTNVVGQNNGGYGCAYDFSGTMPPYRKTACGLTSYTST